MNVLLLPSECGVEALSVQNGHFQGTFPVNKYLLEKIIPHDLVNVYERFNPVQIYYF